MAEKKLTAEQLKALIVQLLNKKAKTTDETEKAILKKQIDKLNLELKAIEKKASEEKNLSAIEKAKKELERLKTFPDGTPGIAPAIAKQEKIIADATKKGLSTPTPTPATGADGKPVDTGVLADNKFSEYAYNPDGTVTNSNGAVGVFVMESDAAGNITPKFYTSSAAGRDAFLKEYAKTGNIESLKAQLIASGYTKQSEIDNGTWATRIDEMLIAYTIKAVSDVKYNGVKEPIGMNAFLKLKKTSKGTGTSTGGKYQVITTRGDAKQILNDYLMDLIGRNSTPEEEEQFFSELSKGESKAVQTSVNGVVTGSVFSETDRLFLAAKVARKSLTGIDVEGLLKSSKGSQVAIQISQLQDASAAYGQPISSTEALKYVIAGVGEKDAVSKQIERMRLNSMTIYGNLKDHIKDGGTVRDITNQYAKIKERKLGIVIPNSLVDKDVMAAVTREGGLMSTAEFNRQMQANPLWRQTDEARDVAADFANTILKSFGFMG